MGIFKMLHSFPDLNSECTAPSKTKPVASGGFIGGKRQRSAIAEQGERKSVVTGSESR